MPNARQLLKSAALALAMLALSACPKPPEYPACSKDKHCQPGESCVDQRCQSCTSDEGCKGKGPGGEDLVCVDFRCESPPAGCQTADDCDAGMICVAGSCQYCTQDSECETGVCNPSGRCEPVPCATDEDCPIDEICDGGQCVYRPLDADQTNAVCGISALYFAFDSARLTPNNQQTLIDAAPCFIELLAGGGELILEAHADNVGGEEYNILLTDRRGTSVGDFLANMGVNAEQMRVVGKGALEAKGGDESSRAKDRRVQFIYVAP